MLKHLHLIELENGIDPKDIFEIHVIQKSGKSNIANLITDKMLKYSGFEIDLGNHINTNGNINDFLNIDILEPYYEYIDVFQKIYIDMSNNNLNYYYIEIFLKNIIEENIYNLKDKLQKIILYGNNINKNGYINIIELCLQFPKLKNLNIDISSLTLDDYNEILHIAYNNNIVIETSSNMTFGNN